MRRFVIIFIVLACIVNFTIPAYCAWGCSKHPRPAAQKEPGAAPSGDCLQKLGRGLCNSITFPMEIPLQIGNTNVSDGPFAALTWGVLKGIGMTALRAAVGVYEVVTFPLPCPADYKPILTKPEYMFEDQIW